MKPTTLQQRLIHHHVAITSDTGWRIPRKSVIKFIVNLFGYVAILLLGIIFWVATP